MRVVYSNVNGGGNVRHSTSSPSPGAAQQQSTALSLATGGQQRQQNVKNEPPSPRNRVDSSQQQQLRPSSASPLSLVHHGQLSPNPSTGAGSSAAPLSVSPSDDSPSAKRSRLAVPAMPASGGNGPWMQN